MRKKAPPAAPPKAPEPSPGRGRKPRYKPTREQAEADQARARARYLNGDRPEDIALEIGCTAKTIRNWCHAEGWIGDLQQRRLRPEQLEHEIDQLMRQPSSHSRDHRLAMLTRSLERMRRLTPAPKPRPQVAAAVNQELLTKVLDPAYGLYAYQRDFIQSEDRYECILKARQIGFSYILGLRAVLGAWAGRHQLIVSASQDQSDIVLGHAEGHLQRLELPYTRKDTVLTTGQAEIRALPANFRTIQGRAGDLLLDEFAWHLKPDRIWSAILPSITQVGGRVTVCSTPFVPGNLFWRIAENHQGRFNHFARQRITIHDALAQGMPLPGGLDELRLNFDLDSWKMFFECEWAEDGSALLSWALLQKLAVPDVRVHAVGRLRAGVDVGRINDFFSLALAGQRQDPVTRAWCEEHILWHWDERKNTPFAEQRQLITEVDSRYAIERWQIDRTGLGADLAEHFANLWPERCAGRWFSAPYKERLALNILRLAEAGHLILPNAPEVLAKLHAVKRHVAGNAIRYDADRDDLGHGDLFWALGLALDGAAKGGHGRGMVKIL